ncbi:MAG: hypothetical protein DMF78_24865, partial [Acidobacteria bacterium]
MRKIVVMSVLLAGGGAAWAGGGRMSIQETAQYVLRANARARQEAHAASVQTTFTEIGVTNPAGLVVVGATADQVGDGSLAWGSALGAPKGVLLVSEQNAGQVAVFNTAGVPKFILAGSAGLLALPG